MDVHKRLEQTFEKVFKRPIALKREMTAFDVDGWDSLTNINLMLMIETDFKIKITAAEVIRLRNVGDLIDLIGKRAVA